MVAVALQQPRRQPVRTGRPPPRSSTHPLTQALHPLASTHAFTHVVHSVASTHTLAQVLHERELPKTAAEYCMDPKPGESLSGAAYRVSAKGLSHTNSHARSPDEV